MPELSGPAARRFRGWHPFLIGVLVGLALLAVLGSALAQGIDHAPFDALLKANVKNGVVNYPGFQHNAAFRKYVDDLGRPATLPTKQDQLAYYINAYNALAIQGILEGLSPSSVLGRARYFKIRDWALNGQQISLYDLEHKILRPLNEPRVHFAIICASKSCPFLRSEAYAAARLDTQLDEQARQFVNDGFRNRFEGHGTEQLVDELGGLPRAARTHQRIVGAQIGHHFTGPFEVFGRAAGHDGELS